MMKIKSEKDEQDESVISEPNFLSAMAITNAKERTLTV